MDYYKVDPTKKTSDAFTELVEFYRSGEQQEGKPVNTAESPVSRRNADPVNTAESPVSRRSSEPVSKSPKPASPPAKSSSPEKLGFFASIKRAFEEGAERAKKERRSRSD